MPYLKNLNFPSEVKKFFQKSITIFIVWKILYHLVLFPSRTPDNQLTSITSIYTTKLLSVTYPDYEFSIVKQVQPIPRDIIYIKNNKLISIADGCNGLELFVLYLGFIISFSRPIKRMVLYSILGLLAIFILNILRCYGIAILNIKNTSITDIAHHYIFKLMIYAVMFGLWVKYTKTKEYNE